MLELTPSKSRRLGDAGKELLAALEKFQALLMDLSHSCESVVPDTPSPLSRHLTRLRGLRLAALGIDVLTPPCEMTGGRLEQVLAGLQEMMRPPEPVGIDAPRPEEQQINDELSEFAISSNGDCWLLGQDETGMKFVTHRANAASGGHETTTSVEAFLAGDPLSPERVTLIAVLADGGKLKNR